MKRFATGLLPTPFAAVRRGVTSLDPFRGWDARFESTEVDSLFTPASAATIGPDEPVPSGPAPVPELPGTDGAFDDPVTGSAGGDYDMMSTDEEVLIYDEDGNDHPLLGDWMSDLATQVLTPIGKSVVEYQQARLAAKAAQKGYGPLTFGPQPAPQPTPSAATPPPVYVQQQPSASFNSKPLIYGALALTGLIVVASMFRGRRR